MLVAGAGVTATAAVNTRVRITQNVAQMVLCAGIVLGPICVLHVPQWLVEHVFPAHLPQHVLLLLQTVEHVLPAHLPQHVLLLLVPPTSLMMMVRPATDVKPDVPQWWATPALLAPILLPALAFCVLPTNLMMMEILTTDVKP